MARRKGFLSYCELIDVSSVVRPTHSISDLWKTAAAIRNLHNEEKCGSRAVWVGNDTIFLLTRTFATLVSSYIPMMVFRGPIAAEEWLKPLAEERVPSP